MKITVLQNHIRLGEITPASNTLCPVARAFRSAGLNVEVGVESAWREYEAETGAFYGKITLPKKVAEFISRMVFQKPLKPFTFTLTKKQVAILREGR